MTTTRFPGWDTLAPAFQRLAAASATRVAPALGPGWGERRSTGERFLHLTLDPECRPALRWFSRQLPSTSPQVSGSCRLMLIEHLPAFVLLTLHAGDVDPTRPFNPKAHPTLHVPVPLPRHQQSEPARRWARGEFDTVMLAQHDGTTMVTPVQPPCHPRDLQTALRHSRLVLNRGQSGHPSAIPLSAMPTGPVLG